MAAEPSARTLEDLQDLLEGTPPEEARKQLSRFVESHPGHSMAHNELGVLDFQTGAIEDALTNFLEAVRLDSGNIIARKNLADLLVRLQRPEEAIRSLKPVLDLHPHDTEALFALASACLLLKQTDEAQFFLQRVLDIDPTHEGARRVYLSQRQASQPASPLPPFTERIGCPFCGETEATRVRSSADIVRCQRCGIIYLRTRPSRERMEELYQSYADDTSHLHLPKNREEVCTTPLRRDYFLDEILQFTTAGGTLLDVGCGWGAFLVNAREHGFAPRGIELTRKAVAYANRELGIPVSSQQFVDTPFEANSIAVVTMLHVLEHLPEPRAAIQKVFDILKPGGMFCGIVPNIDSLCSLKQMEYWSWLDPNYHYVHYSPRTLKQQLERAGFVVERLYTTGGDYHREALRATAKHAARVRTDEEIEEYLTEIERLGYGEEIRFFARKPSGGKADRRHGEVRQQTPQRGISISVKSDEMLVSIIIPVFNRMEFTERCLAALFRNTPPEIPFEVIVVDNASTDGTRELLSHLQQHHPNLRYIRNSQNVLFARACNIGAESARGKYLVFLNNDTEPEAGWLEAGIARLQRNADIGIVGAKLLYPDRTVQHCGIEFMRNVHPQYSLWPLHRYRGVPEDDARVNLPEAQAAVTGACLFIPRRLFKSVRGFTEDYGMYFEDTDLCLKVRRRGKRVFYEPSCVVVHHEGTSSPDRATIDRLNEKAARKFFERWTGEIDQMFFESYVKDRDGKFVFLSPEILPEGLDGTLTQEMLNEGAVRLARLFQHIGPFYAHFGGAGDAALLLSTFYDANPEQTIVSVANSTKALQSFFSAFPKLKRVIFIPYPRYDHSHELLRRLFAQLGNCRGMGATPTRSYFEEWNASLNIFATYGIKARPRWTKQFAVRRIQPIQVTLQPKGSLRGMVGSKRNVVDSAAWSRTLALLHRQGITPIILGTPDETTDYPADDRCIDNRSFSFEEQMQLIASSDLFIGADSWGKTFAALCGVPAVVFRATRGEDLASWKDPSDYVFLDPWKEIAVVDSIEKAEATIVEKLSVAEKPRPKDHRKANGRPGAAVDRPRFVLVRHGGMGDVLMALPVARALKDLHPTSIVSFQTEKRFAPLLRASPSVDEVIVEGSRLQGNGTNKVWDLNPARFGIAPRHQVDAYLDEVGITVPDAMKEIQLAVPQETQLNVESLLDGLCEAAAEFDGMRRPIILLHAACGDVNRTWPAEHWSRLARLMQEEGNVVIAVGDRTSDPARGVWKIAMPGVIDLVGRLTPLEFVALCRRADLLVTTDSGPVQLAAASNIAIAGIYTVVAGRFRLPYRHGQVGWKAISIEPSCPHAGCYTLMNEERHFAPLRRKLARGEVSPAQMFAEWCVVPEKYSCVRTQITPERVWAECRKLLQSTRSTDRREVTVP